MSANSPEIRMVWSKRWHQLGPAQQRQVATDHGGDTEQGPDEEEAAAARGLRMEVAVADCGEEDEAEPAAK